MEFSDLLKKYLKESPYNHIQFAKVCGIDRSLLQKYLNGERRPKCIEQVIDFANKLMLTEDETNQLREAYEILKSGKQLHYQRKSVRKVIEAFGDLKSNEIIEIDNQNVGYEVSKEGSIVIEGKINVIAYFQNIFQVESIKSNYQISVLMPYYSKEIASVLSILCNRSNISIRQILNLSQLREDSEENNVNIFMDTIPLLFGKCVCELRYYYGSQISDLATKNLMCNYILVNGCLLIFNKNLENMIIVKNKTIYHLYEKQFLAIWEKSRLLGKKNNRMNHFPELSDPAYYMGIQGKPCLAMEFTKDFLRKMISDSAGIDEYMKRIEEIKHRRDRAVHQIISIEGCIEFMRYGYLGEFPKAFQKMPVNEKDRSILMRRFCKDIKDGLLDIKMVKKEYLRIDTNIMINIVSREKIIFEDMRDEMEYRYVAITELSIVNAFLDYFDNYLVEEKIYSKEETLTILEDMIKTYGK